MKTQSVISKIPLFALIARIVTDWILHFLFPSVLIDDKKLLKKVEDDAKNGRGIVVVYTHFSYRDGIQLTKTLVVENRFLRDRDIISPLSFHQYNKVVKVVTNFYHERLYPVVNLDTLNKKGYGHLQKGKGIEDFIHAGVDLLKRGGVVMIATNAGRRSKLDVEDPQKPVGYFMLGIQRERFSEYRILLVGLSIEGAKSYMKKDVGGLCVGRKYVLNVVGYYDPVKLLGLPEVSGKVSNVDVFLRKQLVKGLPNEYLPDNCQH